MWNVDNTVNESVNVLLLRFVFFLLPSLQVNVCEYQWTLLILTNVYKMVMPDLEHALPSCSHEHYLTSLWCLQETLWPCSFRNLGNRWTRMLVYYSASALRMCIEFREWLGSHDCSACIEWYWMTTVNSQTCHCHLPDLAQMRNCEYVL